MKGKLLVISAPSGSGKTSIINELLKERNLNLAFSISATSRERRGSEIHGKDYYYYSVDDFKRKIDNNEFVEWEEVYPGRFYGTLKSEIEDKIQSGINIIFDIDVKGGLNIKKIFESEVLTIFIMTPSIEILEERLRNRSTDTEEEILKRISKAKYEMSFAADFQEVIINDNLEEAVLKTKNVIEKFLFN